MITSPLQSVSDVPAQLRANLQHTHRNSLYSTYFGLGHCIHLIDDPKVFKVSMAGMAFGSLLARSITFKQKDSQFLDLGTGSGVHSLLLRSMGMNNITGTDISSDAVTLAKNNETLNFGDSGIHFITSNLFDALPDPTKKYDMILFNPPGWKTPSADFLAALEATGSTEGISLESMFYGDRTVNKFLEQLPNYLSEGGKVIIGLNSLVGIRQAIALFRATHHEEYHIECTLLERHEFPLLFYTENWQRISALLVEEIMTWQNKGDAFCRQSGAGEIFWSYEIVELSLVRR